MFQSTHPHGVRRHYTLIIARFSCFNPRTRTGCDLFDLIPLAPSIRFQSTHPHGVRRPVAVNPAVSDAVSIHAPARGATSIEDVIRIINGVSIHAPARGATQYCFLSFRQFLVSIHAPARGATSAIIEIDTRLVVSIHAPARGAT